MRVECWKVLMCGARDYADAEAVGRELDRLIARHTVNGLIVIHGGAPGADTLAGAIAAERNVHVARVDALWATRHRGAGPQRNTAMLALGPNEVIAFHPNLAGSRGTKDMLTQARRVLHPTRIKEVQ